jgi:hypothetical protein
METAAIRPRLREAADRDWSSGDVAAAFKVAPRTVTKWATLRGLKSYRLPGFARHRRFRPADVLAFAQAHGFPVIPALARAAAADVATERV